mmetsp:Transcript_77973/g.215601  ORF Transcript_77973/g.215601 Transcript_77973/m.215601 type:complete len:251 (+) Transcript_77973:605-1357(+)
MRRCSSSARTATPAVSCRGNSACGQLTPKFLASSSLKSARDVYRKPCMKPPADLRKSSPCVRVPAKNNPGTPTASNVGESSGYLPLCVVFTGTELSKIDVSIAQPKQRMMWSMGYRMLLMVERALTGTSSSRSAGWWRSSEELTCSSSNLSEKASSSMPNFRRASALSSTSSLSSESTKVAPEMFQPWPSSSGACRDKIFLTLCPACPPPVHIAIGSRYSRFCPPWRCNARHWWSMQSSSSTSQMQRREP